jgi:hypothetical protein
MLVLAREPREGAEPMPETVGAYLRRKEAQEEMPPLVPRLVDLRRMAP